MVLKWKDIKTQSGESLERLLQDMKEDLRKRRFQLASNQLKDVRSVRLLKKNVARVLFLLKQKKESS